MFIYKICKILIEKNYFIFFYLFIESDRNLYFITEKAKKESVVISMALLKLGVVCKRLGVSDKTLRNWDKRDFFKPAVVSPGGKRYYTEEQVEEFIKGNNKKAGE